MLLLELREVARPNATSAPEFRGFTLLPFIRHSGQIDRTASIKWV
jgi:hypothetical protein